MGVQVSKGKVGDDPNFPYIKVASWTQTLDDHGKLDRLLGLGANVRTLKDAGSSLEEFWSRYQLMHGGHEVFELARSNKIDLRSALPIYLHGDEGTTYKKDGCLCLSFHCPLGRGTANNKLGPIANEEVLADPHLNFLGHAFETRFLLSALLRVFWFKFDSNNFKLFWLFL